MTRGKDTPQVWQHYDTDGGGYRRLRDMTVSELAERESRQKAYEDMLVRQANYEKSREVAFQKKHQSLAGCVFAKSCKLPDSIIDYSSPSGFVPTDSVNEYGELTVLGGRQADGSGRLPLKKISGVLPAGIGSLALVALLAPSSLGDGALYTDDQLRSLKQARTRVRLRVEEQADGTLKGYGYNTQSRRDWEMIPVVTFETRGSQQVADFGGGVELIWTPAVNPADTMGIPALEAAPQAPQVWIFPPTDAADSIIVSPVYPPEYKDFILVFPADSGVRPLYIVLSVRRKGLPEIGHAYHPSPTIEEITGFTGLREAKKRTPQQGGGGLRERWTDAKGRTVYEWDSMHGELEVYRASDGRHLGSFNHVTGERLDNRKPRRNIKKYL